MKIIGYISKLIILLISCSILVTYASEDVEIGTVKIVTGDYPPYYASSLPGGGPIAIKIMLACKEANLKCKIDYFPWKRALAMIDAGNADLTFTWSITEERTQKYIFSREAVIFSSVAVFFKKSKFPDGIHFTEHKDLVGYTMLGDPTSWYAEDFKKLGVETIWMSGNANIWQMLRFGRAQAILLDTYYGLYTLKKDRHELDASAASIGFTKQHYTAESEFHEHLMFSKPHFNKRRQRIKDSLDKALKKLEIMTMVEKMLDEQYSGDAHEVR